MEKSKSPKTSKNGQTVIFLTFLCENNVEILIIYSSANINVGDFASFYVIREEDLYI